MFLSVCELLLYDKIAVSKLFEKKVIADPRGLRLLTTVITKMSLLVTYTVNGRHSYCAFIQSDVQLMFVIHTHTPRCQSVRQEQLGMGCLAQGHFDIPRAESNRLPSDYQMTALTS